MDAKVRFDDYDLAQVKRVLGVRSDRSAIRAIVRTGVRVVTNKGMPDADPVMSAAQFNRWMKAGAKPRRARSLDDERAYPAMTVNQFRRWMRTLL